MLPQPGVKVVLGTGNIGDASDPIVGVSTPEEAQKYFDVFRAYGGDEIDSARAYSPNAPGTSEPIVGKTNVKEWAKIGSKVKSSDPGDHRKEGIAKSVELSLEALQVPSLDIEYLHLPDPETPLEETLAAIDTAFRAGKFKSFGISNYSIAQVRQMLEISEKNGYVKPTVYQGQYNVIARRPEEELITLLRSNGIKFYAWSPAAGGILGKGTRMTGEAMINKLWQGFYSKPGFKAALERIQEHGTKAGITGHGIALRWALHHSALSAEHGDAIVVGARTIEQLKSTMEICSAGPLPEDIVALIDEVWKSIEDIAPVLSFS